MGWDMCVGVFSLLVDVCCLRSPSRGLGDVFFFFQAEDGIRDRSPSRGLGDVYKRQDIDDGIRAGILKESDIPSEYTDVLGNSTKERLNTMISDIIMNSIGKNDLVMSEPVRKAMTELRKFMFESLYLNPTAKSEEAKADKLITELYRYYVANTDKLPDTYKRFITEFDERPEQVVCDYIAGMSDQYSISKFQEIFVPKAWKG